MKKYIVVPLCICLTLISMSGYFIYNKYQMQVEAQKKLVMAYAAETKSQLEIIRSRVKETPHIVKPFINEIDLQKEFITEKFSGYISLLEQFYIENEYFVREISVHNMAGDVFNIYRENNESIIDVYKPRTANVLRSRTVFVVTDKYAIILPVYKDDVLIGNVAIYLNINPMLQHWFEPYSELADDVWLSVVFDANVMVTLPVSHELPLSHEKNIAQSICGQNAGFLQGKIETIGRVVTYYENFMISEYCMGIAFSKNISSILISSQIVFIVITLVLISLTITVSFVISLMKAKNLQNIKAKDNEIAVWQNIHRNTPVGLHINHDNNYLSNNEYFSKLFNDKALPESFHTEYEFENWELCKFDTNGKEIAVGRRQNKFEFAEKNYYVDAYWELTEMEQHLKNAVKSAITKSQLLNRVGSNVKKTLDNVKNIAVLLMEKFPNDTQIAHINQLSVEMCRMLSEVQEYACIESGNLELKEEPFNLVDEIKKLTDAYQPELQAKGVELQTYVPSSTIRNVVGDSQYFRQILNELLSNAIKFTEKGSIRISIETVDLQSGKLMVKCSVEDTGIGIQRNKLKNIFSVNIRDMEESDTIGLGLIITKKLVDIMGGTMRVASPSPISVDPAAPGTIFSFSVIFVSDKTYKKGLDLSDVSNKKLNALIVTSNAEYVKTLANYLKTQKNINVDTFIYTKDTSELLINKLIIDKERYQMVVISAEKSVTSFEIAQQIHKKELTKNCLYAFINAHAQKGSYTKAKGLYMDYYIEDIADLSSFEKIFTQTNS